MNLRQQKYVRELNAFLMTNGHDAVFGIELTVVFEYADSRSWQSGPQDERCVIELIAQYQTTLEIKRGKMRFSDFQRQSWTFEFQKR